MKARFGLTESEGFVSNIGIMFENGMTLIPHTRKSLLFSTKAEKLIIYNQFLDIAQSLGIEVEDIDTLVKLAERI